MLRSLVLLLLVWSCSTEAQASTTLAVGKQKISAELALTPKQQAKGLMFRKSMPEDAGMLFAFPRDRVLHFYMKNTLIPLSIAYLNKHGIIREIYDMEPLDESTVSSQWPMRYALEMNQGWFKRHNVQVGDSVTLADGSGLDGFEQD